MDCSFDPTGICDFGINHLFLPIWNGLVIPAWDAFDQLHWEIKLALGGILLGLALIRPLSRFIQRAIDRITNGF